MWFPRIKRQQPKRPLEGKIIRQTSEVAEWCAKIKADPPIEILTLASGPLIRLAGMVFSAYVGVTDGTISARSGTTPGSGYVTLQTWSGTALVSRSVNVTAYNISSTAGGIPTGKYCIIAKIMSVYWIITSEC